MAPPGAVEQEKGGGKAAPAIGEGKGGQKVEEQKVEDEKKAEKGGGEEATRESEKCHPPRRWPEGQKRVKVESPGASPQAASSATGSGGGKGGRKGKGPKWEETPAPPYNPSQGGLLSNQWRQRMRNLHWLHGPEMDFQSFQTMFGVKAADLAGLSMKMEDLNCFACVVAGQPQF